MISNDTRIIITVDRQWSRLITAREIICQPSCTEQSIRTCRPAYPLTRRALVFKSKAVQSGSVSFAFVRLYGAHRFLFYDVRNAKSDKPFYRTSTRHEVKWLHNMGTHRLSGD